MCLVGKCRRVKAINKGMLRKARISAKAGHCIDRIIELGKSVESKLSYLARLNRATKLTSHFHYKIN